MAALQRAFALAQMDHVAVLVAEHLKLDVARMLDQFFHVHVRAAKGLLGFGARGLKRGDQFFLVRTMRMPRPPPPSAALIISGRPISAATSLAAASSGTTAGAAGNDLAGPPRPSRRARGLFRPSCGSRRARGR